MKKIIFMFFALLIANGCKNRAVENDPVRMLTDFYTQYITENSKELPNRKVITALYERYLTAELRDRLNIALDFDPFLSAQDCDESWLNSLEITAIEGQDNVYNVCYHYNDFGGEQTNCIVLVLEKRDNSYRICYILTPNALADDEDSYDEEEDNNMETLVNYTYQNKTLKEAYLQFLEENTELARHMLQHLAAVDTAYLSNVNDEEVRITYKPKLTEDGLHIEMLYTGGVTTLDFATTSQGITAAVLYSAD